MTAAAVRTRTARAAASVALASLLAGCGLPLDSGVRVPGPVSGDAQEFGAVQQLPAGPQPDAGPRAIVQGFVSAQVSAEDDHATARQFLAPEIRDTWTDDRVLIRSRELDVAVDPLDETKVVTRADVLASISEDGSYQLESAEPREEEYRLSADAAGQLRLVEVPPGLRLTPEAVAGSFSPQQVYFLQESGRPGGTPHLVPDRVFLPDEDLVSALVGRLLAGPSSALTDAVTSTFPAEVDLRRPVSSTDGVVTIDLAGPLDRLSTQDRQDLSAQLVWTLRGAGQVFTSLRLLVDGRPFRVEGAGLLQDRDDWPDYEPEADAATEALLLVNDGRVQVLSGGLPASEATDGRLPVSAAVASPATGDLALLSEAPDDAGDVVRIGPPRGPFTVALSQGLVGSLSWGSGDDGLWVVQAGPTPRVLLVGDPDTGGAATTVQHVRPAGAGPLSSLRISRDGARAAAVFGEGPSRQVYVGRVERAEEQITRLADFRPVARGLTDVADVAWESGTNLVVLGALGTANRLPVRVAVDGSEVEPVRTLGLDGEPQTLTAAPGRPLVVGAALAGRQVLFVEENGLFPGPMPGSTPSYPG